MWWSFLNLLAALGFLNERQAKLQCPLENTDKGFCGDDVRAHACPTLMIRPPSSPTGTFVRHEYRRDSGAVTLR